MNLRELVVPALLALLVAVGFQLYFGKKAEKGAQGEPASGQMYEVKHDPQAVAPLRWDIDFESGEKEASTIQLETNYAFLTFSTAGAALDKIEFKHGKELLTDVENLDKQHKAFLLACQGKTSLLLQIDISRRNRRCIYGALYC